MDYGERQRLDALDRSLSSIDRSLTRLVDLWEAQLPATVLRRAEDFAKERSEQAMKEFEQRVRALRG